MAVDGDFRSRLAQRANPIVALPRHVKLYFAAIYVIAIIAVGGALLQWRPTLESLGVLVLLIALALAFEEGATRSARLQLRLSSDLKRDMVSVWAIAGAVALEPGASVTLLSALIVFVWFRQQQPAGEILYRKSFNAASVLLACLAASEVLSRLAPSWADFPKALANAVAIFAAIATFAAVNRLIVTIGLINFGVRGRALLGSREDNLIEFATLCLGGLVSLSVAYQPLLAVLVIAPMITLQRGALVQELEMAATTDSKTGLLNALAWDHVAQREIARAARDKSPLGILIIDIDRFKLVNDGYGHLAGDIVLRGLARTLETTLREYDTVGRFGGEEFVAVLPDVSESAAMVIAERVRARVSQMRIADLVERLPLGLELPLAVSIGVACFPTDGDELPELLHAADQALYLAKALGRNRVELARRGDDVPERVTV